MKSPTGISSLIEVKITPSNDVSIFSTLIVVLVPKLFGFNLIKFITFGSPRFKVKSNTNGSVNGLDLAVTYSYSTHESGLLSRIVARSPLKLLPIS